MAKIINFLELKFVNSSTGIQIFLLLTIPFKATKGHVIKLICLMKLLMLNNEINFRRRDCKSLKSKPPKIGMAHAADKYMASLKGVCHEIFDLQFFS